MRLSVVMPTIGRTTLLAAVRSVVDQMLPTDELIVVGDGPQPRARDILAKIDHAGLLYMETWPTHHTGAEQLDQAMAAATGRYILNLGDDDVMPDGALEQVRSSLHEYEVQHGQQRVHVYAAWLKHWRDVLSRSIVYGQVTGQQVVIPREGPRAKYADDPSGSSDHTFLTRTLALREEHPVYHDILICTMERHGQGKVF